MLEIRPLPANGASPCADDALAAASAWGVDEAVHRTESSGGAAPPSRSVVGFGQLLNAITRALTEGAPIPAVLRMMRDHLDASDVRLEIRQRGRAQSLNFSSNEAETFCAARRPDSASRAHDRQCVTSRESNATGDVDYALSTYRRRGERPFDHEEAALAQVLTSQIARALDLVSRMGSTAVETALYSDALDKLNIGVVGAYGDGRIASVSKVAERLLGSRDALQIQAGRLRAATATEDRDLQAAIRAATQGGACRGLSLTKRSGARTLSAMIRPAVGAAEGGAGVAVYLRDCDAAPELEGEFVRQIFDLTPAEAAVTRRLTAGLSLEDAASSLDISRNTARAHLRSIFSKSGITRQTELVRLVLNSAAILGARAQPAA